MATYPVRPLSGVGLRCPAGDCKKQVAVMSERLSSSSIKLNARCSARSGRDYCCVGPKGIKNI
jgi:hypothetical protein